MIMQGIDISHHNYSLIRAKGASYLYDKASLGFVIMKATEGVTFDDPRYNEYIRMIGESNIRYGFACAGAYHYARPENNTALAEAKHFVDRIKPFAGSMLLALDVEGRALQYPNIDKWCYEWLKAVEDMTGGVKPLVYCQRSALNLFDLVPANDYGLWLAAWQKAVPKNPEPWEFMAIWQNNGMNLDTDLFYGDPKQWAKYASGGK
ncbi:MAG: glycoside hydrolase family 25 protein [Prevotella sp.]|nr:glycoside hydrolase family 25 protein [Prevotella sp.]